MTIVFIDDDSEDLDIYHETIRYINESEYIKSGDEKLSCKTFRKCNFFLEYVAKPEERPDIIFMDINMPAVDGKECLKKIKSHKEFVHIPVIMLSTTCTPREANEFKKQGAVECIQKPSDFKELVKIFAKYIFEKYL